MTTHTSHTDNLLINQKRKVWQEPAITFERPLQASAQCGPGPHSPSELIGPLSSSTVSAVPPCSPVRR